MSIRFFIPSCQSLLDVLDICVFNWCLESYKLMSLNHGYLLLLCHSYYICRYFYLQFCVEFMTFLLKWVLQFHHTFSLVLHSLVEITWFSSYPHQNKGNLYLKNCLVYIRKKVKHCLVWFFLNLTLVTIVWLTHFIP